MYNGVETTMIHWLPVHANLDEKFVGRVEDLVFGLCMALVELHLLEDILDLCVPSIDQPEAGYIGVVMSKILKIDRLEIL